MVDHHQTVCCMCGDIGFSEKLFRCSKCLHRFQHSYCSNYYSESSNPIERCDWCQSEEIRSSRNSGSSRKSTAGINSGASGNTTTNTSSRSEYSGEKIKQHEREEREGGAEKAKSNPSGAPSPRPTPRRYKLLKDVMC